MSLEPPDFVTVAPDGRPPEEQPRWRQAFPIDEPQDEYRSRRQFARFLLLTSLAFAAGVVRLGQRLTDVEPHLTPHRLVVPPGRR